METLTSVTDYLLRQSWQIALLVVIVAALSLTLRNKSAHVRYLLWLIVLAKCIVPSLYKVPLAVLPEAEQAKPVPLSPMPEPAVAIETADRPIVEPVMLPRVRVPVPAATKPSQPRQRDRLAQITRRQWLGLGWAAGAALFLLVALAKAWRTNRWLRKARRELPAKLQDRIDDLFAEAGIRNTPKVWLVKGIGQPFVWGLVRGSIYLPANFAATQTARCRRAVLGHELSHVLRFDAAVNFLQIGAQAVYWFHPLVWWANRNIRAEREKCCDESAIARLNALPKDYSRAIVNTLIAEHKSTRPVPSLAVAGPVKNIEDRIKSIMKSGKRFYRRPTFITIITALLLAAIAVPTTLALTARQQSDRARLEDVKFRIFDIRSGLPLSYHQLNICRFVHIRLRRGSPSPYLNREASYYIRSVTTDKDGRFSLDISSMNDMDIVVQPVKDYNLVRFERSSDLSHTKSKDHIRVVRLNAETRLVERNMLYNLKRQMVKVITDGKQEEEAFSEVELPVFALPETLPPTTKPDQENVADIGGEEAATRVEKRELSFGPVIERVLSMASRDAMLDLDKDKTWSPIQQGRPTDYPAVDIWATVYADREGQCHALGYEMMAVPVGSEAWDMTADELVQRFESGTPIERASSTSVTERDELPATLLIRTKELGIGILQVRGFTDNPKGVRIRYKMVQGQPAKVAVGFGPVVERVLSTGTMHSWIDFDTGRTIDDPAAYRPDVKGMDACPDQDQGYLRPTGLMGLGTKTIRVGREQWNASADEVAAELSKTPFPKSLSTMPAEGVLPTFFIETRQGGLGILQITGFTNDRRGLRIRYKMVQGRPAEKSKIAEVSQAVVSSVLDEVVKTERHYPALKGFKESAVVRDYDNVYASLEFRKEIGPANKTHPRGILKTPESCLIRVRIQEYRQGVQQDYYLPPKVGINYFPKLNVGVITEINVSSTELSERLEHIVSASLHPLEELHEKMLEAEADDEQKMNARDVLEAFIENLASGDYEQASHFASAPALTEQFRTEFERLSGTKHLRINYITADDGSALALSSRVKGDLGSEEQLILQMLKNDDIWQIVNIERKTDSELGQIVREFLTAHPGARMIPHGFKGPLELPPNLLTERNRLLSEADANIRKGLVELADRFPHLTKSRDWQEVITGRSRPGQINIGLFHTHLGKAKSTDQPVPENERYSVLARVVPPPAQRWQMALFPMYPNLRLVGQVGVTAGDPELEVALKRIVDDALAPLQQLNDGVKTRSADGWGQAVEGGPLAVIGRVLDRAGGKTVSGAKVELWSDWTHHSWFAVTDENGHYRFDDIEPGPYMLRVVDLPAGIWTEGTAILATDEPRHRNMRSTRLFRPIPCDSSRLCEIGPDQTDAQHSFEAAVITPSRHQANDLYLELPQSVSGIVRNEQTGESVADAKLRFRSLDRLLHSVQTDSEGRYRLFVPPGTDSISCSGTANRYYQSEVGCKIAVRPGEHLEKVDFAVRSAPSFTGRVFSDGSHAPEGTDVWIVLEWRDKRLKKNPLPKPPWKIYEIDRVQRVKTDMDGQFRGFFRNPYWSQGLPYMDVSVTAFAWLPDGSAGGVARSPVTEAEKPRIEPLEILLEDTGSAEFRVVGPDARGVTDADVDCGRLVDDNPWILGPSVTVTESGQGRYRAEGLIPGLEYRCYVKAEGHRHEDFRYAEPVVVQPGQHVQAADVKLDWWGAKAIPEMIKYIRPTDEGIPYNLGKIGPDAAEAVPALVELIKESDSNTVIRRTTQALGKIGVNSKDVVRVLIGLLDRESEQNLIANAAAEALGRLGAQEAVGPIEAALKAGRIWRRTAVTALWRIKKAAKAEAEPSSGSDVTAWGEAVDGLRCRWVTTFETVRAGTSPTIGLEIENVSDKEQLWQCRQGTWHIRTPGSLPESGSGISPAFEIDLGPGVRKASDTEAQRYHEGAGSAIGYYWLSPGGRIVMNTPYPWPLIESGPIKVDGYLWRRNPGGGQVYFEGQVIKDQMTCPPLVLEVVGGITPKTIEGLSVSLSCEQSRVKFAEDLEFTITVENTSTRDVELDFAGADDDFPIITLDMPCQESGPQTICTAKTGWRGVGGVRRAIRSNEKMAALIKPVECWTAAGTRPVLSTGLYRVTAKVGRLTDEGEHISVASEPLRTIILEWPWGPTAAGVKCRLRPEKVMWEAGEAVRLKLEVRNEGSQSRHVPYNDVLSLLEVNGNWHHRREWSKRAGKFELEPGGHQEIGLRLEGPLWFSKESGEDLRVRPGKYVLRAGFTEDPGDDNMPVTHVSNPIEIRILPGESEAHGADELLSGQKLKKLGRVLLVYANDDERGGYPDTLRQLLKGDYIDREGLRWFDENVAYLSKGRTAMDRPGLPLAYDKTLLAKGNGTNILYNDGHVGFAGAEEFKRLGIGDAEVRSEAEPEETGASLRVTLRLIGPDGKAVAAAKVGSMVDWSSTGEAGQRPRVYLPGATSALVSGEDGMVVLEAESLFGSRPVGQGVPIFAYQEDSKLGGLIEVSPRYFGEQVELRLQPLCHVKGRLTSSDLKELGSALGWTNVYARWRQLRPFRCGSDSQRFEFHLPPGQYKLHAYGMHTYNSEVDLDIKPGQDALDLEIDLPADKLAGLIGKPAPELRQIKGWKNGKATRLADLRGKVVLLDFWGYWCGPCIHQMPKLMELHDAFSDKGLVIIAVHNDSVGSIEQMDARLKKAREGYWGGRDLPFLVALDGGGSTRIEGTDKTTQGATTAAYGIMSFPTTVLIDTDGNVVGKVSAYNVEEKIKEMVGAKAPVPAWRERFDEVYRLDDEQILKRIAPPFIPERAEYYRHEHSDQAAAIAEPPDYFTFHWDAALVNWGLGFTGGERPLEAVLKHNLSMGRDAFEGPEELLEIDVQGDWIVRKDSNLEQRLEALEKILEDETGRGIHFIKRRIEREVIVAGGRYQFRGLPGKGRNGVVYMYSDIFDTDSGGGGGTAKSVSEFLAALANRVGVPVIDRTESSGDNTIVYDHHRSSYLGKVTDELERAKKLEMLLANLTKQTDLQFKISAEPVEIWFVTEQAVIEAQPPSEAAEETKDYGRDRVVVVQERLSAREVVERFIAAAVAGEFVEAEKYARPGSAVREQIAELWELEGGQNIETVDVYADTAEAMAISSPIKGDSEKADVLVFHLVNQNQAWLIDALEHKAKDKAQTMLAEFLRKHPQANMITEKTNEPAWGEAVNGLQCRLQPNKSVHRQDEIPACKIDLRHIGADKGVQWAGYREKLEIEVDGHWYRSRVETSSPPFELTPDRPVSEAAVDLEYYHRGHAVWTNEEGYALDLGPGRHVMRARMTVLYGRPIDSDVEKVSLVSNPVKIEISALPERVVHFPKDRSMGKLRVQPWRWELNSDVIMWEELGQAQDAVVVPAGKQLWLQISEEAAKDLSPLTSLRPDDLYMLGLYGDVTDEQLGQIKGLTGLRELFFHEGQIKDEQLAHLKALRGLWTLNLFGKDITDTGLVYLEDIKSLKFAYLGRTQVTMDGIERLQKALPNCVITHTLSKEPRFAWGEVVDGLQLGLVFDGEDRAYRQGEVVGFRIYARNVGDKEVTLAYSDLAHSPPGLQGTAEKPMILQTRVIGGRGTVREHRMSLPPRELERLGKVQLQIGPEATIKNLRHSANLEPGQYPVRQTLKFGSYGQDDSWRGELTTGQLKLRVKGSRSAEDPAAHPTVVPSVAEGRFVLGTELDVDVKASEAVETDGDYVSLKSIMFSEGSGMVDPGISAFVEFDWRVVRGTKWRLKIELLDSEGRVLVWSQCVLANREGGRAFKAFALGSVENAHRAQRFRVALQQAPPDAAESVEQPFSLDHRWLIFVRMKAGPTHVVYLRTIKFEQLNDGTLSATLRADVHHVAEAQWLIRLELLDEAGKVLRDTETIFATAKETQWRGHSSTIQKPSKEEFCISLGPWDKSFEAGRFRLTVRPTEAKPAWGEMAKGLAVRLRADKAVWQAGEAPTLKVDLRNYGSKYKAVPMFPLGYFVEIDEVSNSYEVVRSLWGTDTWNAQVRIAPGERRTGVAISLDEHTKYSKGGLRGALGPGKHTVRVGFPHDELTWSENQLLSNPSENQFFSNPVEIEILPAEKRAGEKERVADTSEQAKHAYLAREAIMVAMWRDPEVRQNHIEENLGYHGGEGIQVLRLLWWARESEPGLRKELLIQWLLEKPVTPERDDVKLTLQRPLTCKTARDVANRMTEIDEVFRVLEAERINRQRIPKAYGPSSGSKILDMLSESVLLADPNNLKSLEHRRTLYGRVKKEASTIRKGEAGDSVSMSILVQLWLFEPNQTLRRDLLWPCIQGVYSDEHNLGRRWLSTHFEPMLKDFRQDERSERLTLIRSLGRLSAEEGAMVRRIESAEKLKLLGQAILVYSNDNENRYPESLRQLREDNYIAEADLRWLIDNVEYLGKGKNAAHLSDVVLAYDRSLLLSTHEGTNVLFNDTHVAFSKRDELQRLGIIRPVKDRPAALGSPSTLETRVYDVAPSGQAVRTGEPNQAVQIQSWFVTTTGKVLVDIGLDANSMARGMTEAGCKISKIEFRLQPPKGEASHISWGHSYMCDDLEAASVIDAVKDHNGSSALATPKVTVLSGECATLSIQTETVVALPPQTTGETLPSILPDSGTIPTGTTLSVTPAVSKDKGHILLKLNVQMSNFIGMKTYTSEVPMPGGEVAKYEQELPHVETLSVQTRASMPDGATLVLAGQKVKSADEQGVDEGLLILIKAEMVEADPNEAAAFSNRDKLERPGIITAANGQLGIGLGPRTLEVNKQLETTIDVSARGLADTQHRFAIYLVTEPVDVGKPEKVNIGQLRLASTPVLTERDIVEYDWDKHVLKLTPEAKKRMPGPKTVWPLPFVVVADGQRCYLGAFWSIYSSYMPEIPHIDSFFPGRPANEIEIGPAPGDGGTDLRSDPRINKVLQQLGLIRETKQYLESQEKLYQEKTAAEPNNPEAWAQLGKTRLKLGKYAAAKEVFESCLKLDSEHVAALEGLGQTLEQMGRVDQAIARYQKAIETFTRLWTDASPDGRYSPKGKPSPSAAPTPPDMPVHAACRLAAFHAERCEYELALKYLQGLPGCRDEAVKAKVDGLKRALDYAERLGWGKASNGLQIRLVVPIAEREQMPRLAADKLDAWLEVRNVSDGPLKLVERNIPPLSYLPRAEDRDWLVGLHINVRSEGQPMRLFSRAYDKKYRWSHVGGAGGIFTGRIEPGGTSRFRIRLRRLEHDGMNLLSLRGPCELQAVLNIEEVSTTFWHGKAVGASVPVMIGQNKDEVIDSHVAFSNHSGLEQLGIIKVAKGEPGMAVSPRTVDINKQLDTVVDLSHWRPKMAFAKALDDLSNAVAPPLSIVVMWGDLAENADINRTTPIRIAAPGMGAISTIRLAAALRLLLASVSEAPQELGYVVKDNSIFIATEKSLLEITDTRAYKLMGEQKPVINIELRLAMVSEQFLEDIGLDMESIIETVTANEDANSERRAHEPFEQLKAVELRLSRSVATASEPPDVVVSPGFSGILDNTRMLTILAAIQAHRNAKMLAAPKIMVPDGESAEFRIASETPYVAGYTEPNATLGQPQPIVNHVQAGLRVQVLPKLVADGDLISADIDFEHSQIIDFEPSKIIGLIKRMYQGKYPDKIPVLEAVSFSTSLPVPTGQSALIVGQKLTGEDADGRKVDKRLLILIKPQKALAEDVPANESPGSPERAITGHRSNSQIYRALERTVDLSGLHPEMTFANALDEIRNSVEPPLSIVVMWNDLAEKADIDRTTAISINGVSAIRLGTALELLLRSVSADLAELGYVVKDGVIIIATKKALPKVMETRVYGI